MIYSFNDIVFPASIARKSIGGPEFLTSIATSLSGHEYRNVNWQLARMRYQLKLERLTPEELQQVINLFYIQHGCAIGFRFRDWSDYQVDNGFICTVTNGDIRTVPLIKEYRLEDFSYQRRITKPAPNTVKVYLNDTEIQPDTVNHQFSIDYEEGLLNFQQPLQPETVIRASFDFDVPVRFNNDYLPLEFNERVELPAIELLELK